MKSFDCVVLGSCMVDLICYSPRLPSAGETIHGTDFSMGKGGKGANQCIAAAKLGASTALIATLGYDDFGKGYLSHLEANRVNTERVVLSPLGKTGMAQISVAENGENHIIIVAGANNSLSPSDARHSAEFLTNSKVALFQFETPLKTTLEALKLIKEKCRGPKPVTIVNGAPGVKNVPPEILSLCDIFCVNESEAGVMLDQKIKDVSSAKKAVGELQKLGCSTVIITLGSEGAVFAERDSSPVHIKTDPVKAVDTTGAGDAFLGALAYWTAKGEGMPLDERIKRSCKLAAFSVMGKGTQTSFPNASDLKELFP